MNEIIMLDIRFKFGEVEDVIHPVILIDDKNMVLIDCGYTGFLPAVERAMAEKNLLCSNVTHVLMTHHDHDHMGALSELIKKYPRIQVVASKKETPYISGRLKSLRLKQAEAKQPNLPEEQKAFGLAFCNVLKNVQPAKVDVEVQDGDVLDWCGGCIIIGTPGHTPGHISVFAKQKKVMIAGDAAALEKGELVIANPQYTLDRNEAEASLRKIVAYGAKEMICYHGGILVL